MDRRPAEETKTSSQHEGMKRTTPKEGMVSDEPEQKVRKLQSKYYMEKLHTVYLHLYKPML